MATDKKISELTSISTLTGNEIGVLASGGWDYQFTLSVLLQYIGQNLSSNAATSFGSVLPQNINGRDGDLFINTANNSFAQKINGQWVVKYQPPTGNANTTFGLGAPANTTGNNGDVYINTGSGIFYKKTNNAWLPAFSMQSGPPGPPGVKGDTGAAGLSGNSILSGTVNPSNLTTGANGDFYINSSNWYIFGPKTNGAWPAGVQIETAPQPIIVPIIAGVTTCPLAYSYDGSIGDNPYPRMKLKNNDGSYTYDNDVAVSHNADTSVFSVAGQPDGDGKFLYDYVLILYPGGTFNISAPATDAAKATFPFSLPFTLQF